MNNETLEESIEIFLFAILTTAALSLILVANFFINQSNDNLPPINETVFIQSEEELDEIIWTGAQIKYLLWDIENTGAPIQVGGVTFTDLEDVRELIDYIYPTVKYRLNTGKDALGNVTTIQFTMI